ncbi:hypothetical protein PGTUg99_020923 [Puccinia graminis f. sp. tritici]|uniref:Methyltransferase-like protein 14 n=1 Tax=Puccinia graminis f. sp. tritici TaxID=56615 RepID=A0A5B0RD22_PUCGR|nr:hypothetical protein PGTUg99_020923 [Puccinia graminis f. sp. tritici]
MSHHDQLTHSPSPRPKSAISAREIQQLSSKKRHKRLAYGPNYIPEEETIRNDYSLNYVLTGSRPQNHIQNTALETRFAEYPKLKKLLQLKRSLVTSHAHPPTYIQADLRPNRPDSFNLLELSPARFDVILLDPPLKEYVENYPALSNEPSIAGCGGPPDQPRDYWDWDELENLPLPQIAASPGFVFLWCGSGQGSTLERGRALLAKWGYRKCEDLVWIKTNSTQIGSPQPSAIPAVFTPTKEHCLMGIRGTVRRSTDGHFVHCNVDTDVIVSEPDPTDVLHKPEELYQLIENFCLGRRRLELFGSSRCLRPGWLTIGSHCAPPTIKTDEQALDPHLRPVPYSQAEYLSHFLDSAGRTHNLLPSHADIDNLRPRSPPSRITTAAITGPGLAPGMGIGYAVPVGMPIVGPGGTIVTTTISGRNTLSHPSGGLGRGPGNALLPGMRVSGLRDSNNPIHNRANNNNNNQQQQQQQPFGPHANTFFHHTFPLSPSYPFLQTSHYPAHQSWTGHPQLIYPHQHFQAGQNAYGMHQPQPIYYHPPNPSQQPFNQQFQNHHHQQQQQQQQQPNASRQYPAYHQSNSPVDPASAASNWTFSNYPQPHHQNYQQQPSQPFYPSYAAQHPNPPSNQHQQQQQQSHQQQHQQQQQP